MVQVSKQATHWRSACGPVAVVMWGLRHFRTDAVVLRELLIDVKQTKTITQPSEQINDVFQFNVNGIKHA